MRKRSLSTEEVGYFCSCAFSASLGNFVIICFSCSVHCRFRIRTSFDDVFVNLKLVCDCECDAPIYQVSIYHRLQSIEIETVG